MICVEGQPIDDPTSPCLGCRRHSLADPMHALRQDGVNAEAVRTLFAAAPAGPVASRSLRPDRPRPNRLRRAQPWSSCKRTLHCCASAVERATFAPRGGCPEAASLTPQRVQFRSARPRPWGFVPTQGLDRHASVTAYVHVTHRRPPARCGMKAHCIWVVPGWRPIGSSFPTRPAQHLKSTQYWVLYPPPARCGVHIQSCSLMGIPPGPRPSPVGVS